MLRAEGRKLRAKGLGLNNYSFVIHDFILSILNIGVVMNRVLKDLYGSWILFFHYLKWPIVLGLPILYFDLDYKRNIVMDIIWGYCLYLVIVSLYQMYKNRGKPKSCNGRCGS